MKCFLARRARERALRHLHQGKEMNYFFRKGPLTLNSKVSLSVMMYCYNEASSVFCYFYQHHVNECFICACTYIHLHPIIIYPNYAHFIAPCLEITISLRTVHMLYNILFICSARRVETDACMTLLFSTTYAAYHYLYLEKCTKRA